MTRAMKRLYGNPERLQRNQVEATTAAASRPKRRVRRGPGRMIIPTAGGRPQIQVIAEMRP